MSKAATVGETQWAPVDEAAGVSGIWVASVESGSPASNAGVRPGDIIVGLEGLALAEDGTMKAYCDVLQTKGSDRVLKIQVVR